MLKTEDSYLILSSNALLPLQSLLFSNGSINTLWGLILFCVRDFTFWERLLIDGRLLAIEFWPCFWVILRACLRISSASWSAGVSGIGSIAASIN